MSRCRMLQLTFRSQKTTLGSWFSPATWWELGIELRSLGSAAPLRAEPGYPKAFSSIREDLIYKKQPGIQSAEISTQGFHSS